MDRITRRFSSTAGVSDVSFSVEPGELLALVGASGSGKTTTLRVVAGYEQAESGRVLFGDEDITSLPPQLRGFGMVFQHYALFPHMSVEENVAFGLEARGTRKRDRLQKAREALAAVGLANAGKRAVQSLSGGEQQRVALARVLVIEPRALLLDEPLSNLDPALRQAMRVELSAMLHRAVVPALLVTHDQEDAFAIADRVAVLGEGRVLQIGKPDELYDAPASLEVARFIGRGGIVEVRDEAGHAVVTFGDIPHNLAVRRSSAAGAGARKYVLLRPESLRLTSPADPGAWKGVVRARRFAGSSTVTTVELEGGTFLDVEGSVGSGPAVGEKAGVMPTGAVVPLFGA